MAAFSVFFCDQERCSIRPVRAMDPEHAIAQVRSCVPDLRRVAVVPDELLEGVDPQQLLQEWMKARVYNDIPPVSHSCVSREERAAG